MKENLDQYYTKDDVAEKYYKVLQEYVDINEIDFVLEPSAGMGAFFKILPENKRLGLDLEPKFNGIEKQDFFDFIPVTDKKYITVGNPPFGTGSNLAVKFFNHAAKFSKTIAFILPRTFKRTSIQNKLHYNFHLIYNEDLPIKPCCFEPEMMAKCCFQIWEKKEIAREKIIYPNETNDFSFLKYGPLDDNKQPTPPQGADFAIKAYGSNCGEIIENNLDILRPKSFHFILSKIETDVLKLRLRKLNYSISEDTARQNSLGKGELINLYENKFEK